ncbi:TetR/AcrR family transcriptional regulator [Paenibacillus glycanilyticus]|uniref:TetR/AcrR family transcriptional regulator n=1 Tax=Paenibacillus glycanilyticus TaxID=126569 RepID=UPI000FDCBF20|nr:TetR/AcrR family transcriptional regulator [Paenibacillus glycanilyticus]
MKKQSQTTIQTRQNLTDAFWSLYRTKRIEKISIKEITAKAGYNRGTFYEYFKDAYDVLEQIENDLLVKLQERMLTPLQTDVAIMDISMQVVLLIQSLEELNDYYMVLLGDQGDPAFLSKIKNSFKPLLMARLTGDGAKEGFELDYTVEYTLNAMIGIFHYWFSQSNKPPLEQLFALMNELLNDGVMKKIIALQVKSDSVEATVPFHR